MADDSVGQQSSISPSEVAARLLSRRPSTDKAQFIGLSLPLGKSSDNNRNQFNLAKARADAAAAAAAAAGSRGSTYRSRRQSGSSQISFSSKASFRSVRGIKGKRKLKGNENLGPEHIQVFDASGKNVTPKPLVSLKPTVLHEKVLQATNESERSSVPVCSRTGYSITSSAGSLTPETVEGDETDRDDGQVSGRPKALVGVPNKVPEVRRRIQIVGANRPPLTEKEKEKTVYVFLRESESSVLLHLKGANFNAAYESIKEVLERNSKYEKLLQIQSGETKSERQKKPEK